MSASRRLSNGRFVDGPDTAYNLLELRGMPKVPVIAQRFVVVAVIGLALLPTSAKGSITTLKCGALLDGISNTPLKFVLIQIDGNRIVKLASYNPTSTTAAESGVIDLSNETCLPGLIDLHVHAIKANPDNTEPSQPATGDNLRQILNFGFTTVRNLGSPAVWPSDVKIRQEVEGGVLFGPRMKVSLNKLDGLRDPSLRDANALRSLVDRIATAGGDWVKLFADVGWEDRPQYSEEELSAVVKEAHARGMKVALHAIGLENNRRAVASKVDSIEHGVDVRDEDLRRALQSGIVLVPTIAVLRYMASLPGRQDHLTWVKEYSLSKSTFERAMKAGVKIAFGTDAYASSIEDTNWHNINPASQFGLMVELGMSPMQAILTGTKAAAELLDMDKQIGSIAPGMLADIIATPGEPLSDTHQLEHVNFVMKNGEQVRGK
jgi:imidazolonepropionase-like amidohydrolase